MLDTKPRTLALLAVALACAPQTPASTTTESTSTSAPPGSDTTRPTDDSGEVAALGIDAVEPALVDPDGGSRLLVHGTGFEPGMVARIAGVEVAGLEWIDAATLRLTSPALADSGPVTLELMCGTDTAEAALIAWSPAAIPGARVFDASHAVTTGAPRVTYEWQRLTASIGDEWRVRDGHTLTWVPTRQRFVMVAGWNGEAYPEGFSTVGPEVYPPENTTGEVWSSADGITWSLDLPHGHTQFERRHMHNTVLWNDQLWMIGGDHHQGHYNPDVVASADGLVWQVELGAGATPPPWSERAGQVSGVYAGKLWTVGGHLVRRRRRLRSRPPRPTLRWIDRVVAPRGRGGRRARRPRERRPVAVLGRADALLAAALRLDRVVQPREHGHRRQLPAHRLGRLHRRRAQLRQPQRRARRQPKPDLGRRAHRPERLGLFDGRTCSSLAIRCRCGIWRSTIAPARAPAATSPRAAASRPTRSGTPNPRGRWRAAVAAAQRSISE